MTTDRYRHVVAASARSPVGWSDNSNNCAHRPDHAKPAPDDIELPLEFTLFTPTHRAGNRKEPMMDAIREWVDVIDQTVTIRLPAQFQATRVEVIVLAAADSDVKAPAIGLRRRQPSPLLAGTRIIGDIMAPVVDADDWDALR